MHKQTCIAPVNIAVIKYWGKRDEELLLPLNDSLSITLNTDQMCAKTTIAASVEFKENRFWLNGEVADFDGNPRLVNCLDELKRIASSRVIKRFPINWKIHVCSENNFPTAAGLASSAAGYACFVYALAALYGIEDEELSRVARLGSGSACRSLKGGFVQWVKGEKDNGFDSVAVQLAPKSHWPEMRVLILVVSDKQKKHSSTKGMQRSVLTSKLLKYRANHCVPKRISHMRKAIDNKDFEKFADLTMKDSNQFHATCLDTYPPCVYMTDNSHAIVEFVHKYNRVRGEVCLAYTFDAGPNACLFMVDTEVGNVVKALLSCFPSDSENGVEYFKGLPINYEVDLPLGNSKINDGEPLGHNVIKYIIHTQIGDGPMVRDDDESLLNEAGTPKSLSA